MMLRATAAFLFFLSSLPTEAQDCNSYDFVPDPQYSYKKPYWTDCQAYVMNSHYHDEYTQAQLEWKHLVRVYEFRDGNKFHLKDIYLKRWSTLSTCEYQYYNFRNRIPTDYTIFAERAHLFNPQINEPDTEALRESAKKICENDWADEDWVYVKPAWLN